MSKLKFDLEIGHRLQDSTNHCPGAKKTPKELGVEEIQLKMPLHSIKWNGRGKESA